MGRRFASLARPALTSAAMIATLFAIPAAMTLAACGGSGSTATSSPSATSGGSAPSPPSPTLTSGSSVSAWPGGAATLSWTRTAFNSRALEDHWDGIGVLRDGRVSVAFLNWWNWTGEASPDLQGAKLGPWAAWTSADGVSWTRSSRLPVATSALISGVVRWKRALVVVGTEGSRPTRIGNVAFGHPVTWTSRGGGVWCRSPDQESLRYAGADRRNHGVDVSDVAAGGRYLVMSGSDWWNAASHSVARIWTSADGLTWKRAAIASEAKSSYVGEIVTGGPVLLALGQLWDDPAGPMQYAIWTSADGRVWRAADVSAMRGEATVDGVVAGGAGFVACGRKAPSSSTPTTWGKGMGAVAVWTSADGRTWSRVADPGFGAAADIVGMAAAGPGLIAYGQEGGLIGGERSPFWRSSWGYGPHWGHAAVWTSTDGLRWQKAADFPPLDSGLSATSDPDAKRAGNTIVFSVLKASQGWVALGARTVSQWEMESVGMTPSERAGRLLLWTSRDARHWTPYVSDELVDGDALSLPVVSHGRVLVVGRDERLSRACAWSVSLPTMP